MEKITAANWSRVRYMDSCNDAAESLGMHSAGSLDFWMVREKARILNHTYTPINIPGDDPMRFLHQSLDDPDKVSYTKNADKGREDLQTRTTLADYCEKFGLDAPTTVPRCENLTPPPSYPYQDLYQDLFNAVRAYFDSKAETVRLKKALQEMI